MKLIQWLAFAFIVAIIAIRSFWPEVFALHKYSIGLLFLLAIPLLAPFLKKAKWFVPPQSGRTSHWSRQHLQCAPQPLHCTKNKKPIYSPIFPNPVSITVWRSYTLRNIPTQRGQSRGIPRQAFQIS